MAGEFWSNVDASFFAGVLAALCVLIGFLIKGQARMLEIQGRMLDIQADLGRAQALLLTDIKRVDGDNDYQTTVALDAVEDLIQGGWQHLPEGERLRLKSTLLTLLAQMNRPDLQVD